MQRQRVMILIPQQTRTYHEDNKNTQLSSSVAGAPSVQAHPFLSAPLSRLSLANALQHHHQI